MKSFRAFCVVCGLERGVSHEGGGIYSEISLCRGLSLGGNLFLLELSDLFFAQVGGLDDDVKGNSGGLQALRSLSDLRLTARFLPFSPEASLLLASGEPPSFVFAAIRGGFSSLSLGTLSGCESIDSHTLLLRCQNTHVAQLCSVFVALHQEEIIKNRLEVLKSDRLLVSVIILQVEGIENDQAAHRREVEIFKNGVDEAAAIVFAALAFQQIAHEEVVHWIDILVHDQRKYISGGERCQ